MPSRSATSKGPRSLRRLRPLTAALAACAVVILPQADESGAGQVLTKRERRLLEERGRSTAARVPSGPQLDALYEELQTAFLGQDPSRAELLTHRYLERDASSPRSGEVLYLQALARIQSGRTAEARESLAKLLANPAWKRWAEEARISVADSYWKEGDVVKARAAYEDALRRGPRSEWAGYLRSRLELSKPPSSPEPSSAEEQPFFTVQVGSFAETRNARKLLDRLEAAGYEAYLASDPGRGVTRVRVGRLSTRSAAETLARRLRSDGWTADIVR